MSLSPVTQLQVKLEDSTLPYFLLPYLTCLTLQLTPWDLCKETTSND